MMAYYNKFVFHLTLTSLGLEVSACITTIGGDLKKLLYFVRVLSVCSPVVRGNYYRRDAILSIYLLYTKLLLKTTSLDRSLCDHHVQTYDNTKWLVTFIFVIPLTFTSKRHWAGMARNMHNTIRLCVLIALRQLLN